MPDWLASILSELPNLPTVEERVLFFLGHVRNEFLYGSGIGNTTAVVEALLASANEIAAAIAAKPPASDKPEAPPEPAPAPPEPAVHSRGHRVGRPARARR